MVDLGTVGKAAFIMGDDSCERQDSEGGLRAFLITTCSFHAVSRPSPSRPSRQFTNSGRWCRGTAVDLGEDLEPPTKP